MEVAKAVGSLRFDLDFGLRFVRFEVVGVVESGFDSESSEAEVLGDCSSFEGEAFERDGGTFVSAYVSGSGSGFESESARSKAGKSSAEGDGEGLE